MLRTGNERMMSIVAVGIVLAPILAAAQPPLASTAIELFGVRLQVATEVPEEDRPIQVPLNTAVPLSTSLTRGDGAAVDAGAVFDGPTLLVRGRLHGKGLAEPLALETPLGQPLRIPPLAAPGPYELDDVHLVNGEDTRLLDASPSVLHLAALDRIFTSAIITRQLTRQEIDDLGLIIDPSSYTVYQFTFGFGTTSNQVPITLDMLFKTGAERETGATMPLLLPPELEVPSFDVTGLVLGGDNPEGDPLPPIPGVLIIPGNIAVLHGFFDVQLAIANVTPPGSRLVITEAAATLDLPLGDNGEREFPDDEPVATCLASCGNPAACDVCTDEPLWPARPANPPPWDALCGPTEDPHLPCASVVNTQAGSNGLPADERAIASGQQGVANFSVEGRRVGTHRLRVSIAAELQLATGTVVPLSGEASGTVVVRDPRFSLTINHPDVVRANEPYSLFVTVRNTTGLDGTPGTIVNDVQVALDPRQISGATLLASLPSGGELGTATIDTIAPGDAALIEYRLIARQNGRVTAAAFGGDVPGAFVLRTGIGDQGIPLSPDTLILPREAQSVPPDFLTTASRLTKLSMSRRNSAPYSAAAEASSSA